MKKDFIHILVLLRQQRISRSYIKSIRKRLGKPINELDRMVVSLYKRRWRELSISKLELLWLHYYSFGKNPVTKDFVPENIYYTKIEPLLNETAFSIAYSDKNFYELFYKESMFPETILRCIDGSFYNQNYEVASIQNDKELNLRLNNIQQLIIKPSIESGGGVNVILFKNTNGFFYSGKEFLTLSYLDSFQGNFVIQQIIQQHAFLQQFCSSSVNTIRILTYRSVKNNKVYVLHGVLRVGVEGSYVDNARSGGFSIGINESGVLNRFAMKKSNLKYPEVNGFSLDKHLLIPQYELVKQKAIEIAERNIHQRLLGLDMVITSNNVVKCIEVNNSGNEINFYQLNNGALFGRFTDEVVEYCCRYKNRLFKQYDI